MSPMILYVEEIDSNGWTTDDYIEASPADVLRWQGWEACFECLGSGRCLSCAHGMVPPDWMVVAAAEALTEKRPGIVGEIEMAAALHFATRALVEAARKEKP